VNAGRKSDYYARWKGRLRCRCKGKCCVGEEKGKREGLPSSRTMGLGEGKKTFFVCGGGLQLLRRRKRENLGNPLKEVEI